MNGHRSYTFIASIIISFFCLGRSYEPQRDISNCTYRCGNISIPYPFGIGPPHCSFSSDFAVSCNTSSSSSQIPFLKTLNLEILKVTNDKITWENGGNVVVKIPPVTACSSDNNTNSKVYWTSHNLTNSPFRYSYRMYKSPFRVNDDYNVFASVGCDGYALIYNERSGIREGCTSVCRLQPPAVPETKLSSTKRTCTGYHSCQVDLISNYHDASPKFTEYSIIVSINNSSENCRSAFLISYNYLKLMTSLVPGSNSVPIVLEWGHISHIYWGEDGPVILLFKICFPASILAIVGYAFCRRLKQLKNRKRRKAIKLRVRYFKEKLEVHGSSNSIENIKLFTFTMLKRCTDNFSKDCELGQGGQGTVYKGRLGDGKLVAVKKSRALDDSQWLQFINEIFLLSEIKHRHVVKILGCCLDHELPLVVYEYISNGTLWQLIQNPRHFIFMWEMRLRIAYEVATAITYLHTEFSSPVYHRDIKSDNILLDENFRAILSDFGISSEISMEQTHLTTCVKGTFGYLDPEYFYSSQYSEKSDVYSFGVVLVELLTGQKPIRGSQPLDEDEDLEDRSLVMYFTSSMNDSALLNIVDSVVLQSGKTDEIMEFANLAKLCVNQVRVERPTMKEVTRVLERIRCGYSNDDMPLTSNDVHDNAWVVHGNSMSTSTEIEIADLTYTTYTHVDRIGHSNSAEVEMRLAQTT